MNWLRTLWGRLFIEAALLRAENKRLRETCLVLEDENAELKKDLRAAVNNLLSEAGATPLPSHEELKPPSRKMANRRLTWQQRQRIYAQETAPIVKELEQ